MDDQMPAQADPKDKTVLIIEDDESMQTLMQMLLEEEGFAVQTAASAEEAAGKIGAKAPDLIVLDFMLPGQGGYETLRGFQQQGETAGTPVVVATARRLDSSMVRQIKNEPNVREYFLKPIQHSTFTLAVHKILNTRPPAPPPPPDKGPLSSSW